MLKIKYGVVMVFNVLLVAGVWFVMRGGSDSIDFAKSDSRDAISLHQNTLFQPDSIGKKGDPSLTANLSTQTQTQNVVSAKPPVDNAPVIEQVDIPIRDDAKTVESIVPIQQDQPVLSLQGVRVSQEVPFLVQAPYGEWGNAVFQHACEEASMIMAMSWAQGKPFSIEEGKQSIESITKFESKKFKTFVFDTSAKDTAQVMKEYFGYENIEVKTDIVKNDMISALESGAIIMVPVNGRLLRNPYFTAPGPAEHMLVITGYDPEAKEFITNDPGTRHGEKYRYNEDILYNAMRDYMTGNRIPVQKIHKTMIVVRR